MNKKTAIVSVLLGVLLIGIVSAGLLDYFGKIEGSVVVEGPVFYANSQEIDLFGTEVKELSINTFTASTSAYTLTGGESKIFWTEEFDESLDFYKPELKLYARARIVEGEIPKGLDLIFGYYQGDNTYEICRGEILVGSTELEPYNTLCDIYQEQNLPINNADGFYYEIKGKATPNVDTKISLTNQETKAQVLGAVE